MTTTTIEAGARALDDLVEIGWSAIVGHDIAATCHTASITRGDLRTALKAALSGHLVPASAVADMRERCIAGLRNMPNINSNPDTADGYEQARKHALRLVRALDLSPAGGDYVVVPKSALDWLFGEGPDADGKWFGECQDDVKPIAGKYKRTYWWRSKFRALLNAATGAGD